MTALGAVCPPPLTPGLCPRREGRGLAPAAPDVSPQQFPFPRALSRLPCQSRQPELPTPAPRLPSELLRQARRLRAAGRVSSSQSSVPGRLCPGSGRSARLQPRSSLACLPWGTRHGEALVAMERPKRVFPCYIVKTTSLTLFVPCSSFASLRQGWFECGVLNLTFLTSIWRRELGTDRNSSLFLQRCPNFSSVSCLHAGTPRTS